MDYSQLKMTNSKEELVCDIVSFFVDKMGMIIDREDIYLTFISSNVGILELLNEYSLSVLYYNRNSLSNYCELQKLFYQTNFLDSRKLSILKNLIEGKIEKVINLEV